MILQNLITWFLPSRIRHDKTHPDYYQMYTVASANIAGIIGMGLIPLLLAFFKLGSQLWAYPLGVVTYMITLCSLRLTGHWRVPTYLCAVVAYYIIYTWLKSTGLIFSLNIAMLHLYIIAAILVDRRWGWTSILGNIALLSLIYYLTITANSKSPYLAALGSPLYAFLVHCTITCFIGGLLAYVAGHQEKGRRQIRMLQDQKISMLDEAVRKRTEQLNSMRQTIATDFHDQTGNMLAAINRQAAILELNIDSRSELQPLVRSIITNSNELYASSKDFIWNLNHDSDDPQILFKYLTSYGQHYYNQFDIAFSAEVQGSSGQAEQLSPFAALNLIYIFKEAMSNVIKHSGADEVIMAMDLSPGVVCYTLKDNGKWKAADPGVAHYGRSNMERRSRQSGFRFILNPEQTGTSITISVPLTAYLANNNTE